jgi:hypothetical protein
MRNHGRATAAVLCAVVLAATSAGCGGGGDDKTRTDPAKAALTQYAKTVGTVCTEQAAKIQDSIKAVDSNSPEAAQDAAFAKAGDGFLAEVKLLGKVTAPDSISKDVDAWLSSLEAAAKVLKRRGTELLANGSASPFADAAAKASALGLTDCAKTIS